MKVRFVSHASFSVESGGTTLLTDPWLVGKAFNDGWCLLSPAASVQPEKVDYLWISHQHPDHLNFPTLKSIPQQERGRIRVLYQRHASPRITRALVGLGYTNVHELPQHRWVRLPSGMEVICGSVGSMDSWLAIRAENQCILNLNDCVLGPWHTRQVRYLVGGPISLLFTQFSFANWIGNHADDNHEAERKIFDLQFQHEFFKPEATVPFASFIYFCNRENSWMNNFAVTPRRIIEELRLPGVNFMYPGDEWDSAVRHFNSAEAVHRYMSDLQRLSIDPTPPSTSPSAIENAVTCTLRVLHSRFSRVVIGRIAPFEVYLHDIDKVAKIHPGKAHCHVLDATESGRNARYVMCSQVLWFTFAYIWGWGTTEVSGMFLDREYSTRGKNPIGFYLNLLSTECLTFKGFAQSLRTLEFLWSKRVEIGERFIKKVSGIIRGRALDRYVRTNTLKST